MTRLHRSRDGDGRGRLGFLGLWALTGELRHAWRGLLVRPVYGLFVVGVLALGIGSASTVGTALHQVLLAPLPYPEARRIVAIWDENPSLGISRSGPTPANMLDWRARSRAFTGVAAYYAGEPRTLETPQGAEKVAVAEVTEDFFSVLAQAPALGRVLSAEEVAGELAVTVLGHGLWQRRFGGDPAAVGRTIAIDGVDHLVIGVMPPSFAIPDRETALWLPWDFDRRFAGLGHVPRDYRYLRVLARLAPGGSLADAQADMDRVAAELAAEYPVNRGWRVRVVPLKEELVGAFESPLLALSGGVLFVLLIAVVNAAHLLVGRLIGRVRELSLRRALGASRLQLLRLVGLEALLLACGGGLAGWLLAGAMMRGVQWLAPPGLPRLEAIELGSAGALLSLLITAGVALVLMTLVALANAMVARGRRLSSTTRQVGIGRGPWPGRLISTQIAAAFVLLVMALLTVQSLTRLLAVDPGFATDRLLVARVFPDAKKYATADRRIAYFDALESRIAELPGVRSVGAASGLPMNVYNNTPSTLFARSDAAVEAGGAEADVYMTTVGYHRTLGMRLVEGRFFDRTDQRDAAPVVIVNQELARAVWGMSRAVGERLRLRFGRGRDQDFEVVGVVASARSDSLKAPPRPEAFRPHAQVPYVTMNVVVETDLDDPLALAAPIRQAILDLDATQPVHSITTVEALIDRTIAPDRLAMAILAALAGLALALSAVGVYGVMAQAVRTRVPEIGVRMALGATPARVVIGVLRRAGGHVGLGLLAGWLGALAAAGLLEGLLYGIAAIDPTTWLIASIALAALVAMASWAPAARAAAVDPSASLRADS